MKLPTLYSRRSDGKVQEWTIEVRGDRTRVRSGITDGEKVESGWAIHPPKNVGRSNATTGPEQALKDAQSEWTKKRDRGYREKISEVDQSLHFEPMLAHKYEDHSEALEFPLVWSQPKLDGIRCIATKVGLFTRNGKPILAAPHISSALERVFKKNPGRILDGELYSHALREDFNRITSLVRKTKPSEADLAASQEEVQYWIYDEFYPDLPFPERHARYLDAVMEAGSPSIVGVATAKVKSQKDLDLLYEAYLEEGFEGQIVRCSAGYENKRSKRLLKRKEFQDQEFEILDLEEGVGNRAGTVGHFILRNERGQVFHSNAKGDMAHLKELLQRRTELIGKQATVKFFKYTPDGIPRFPFVTAIRDYE